MNGERRPPDSTISTVATRFSATAPSCVLDGPAIYRGRRFRARIGLHAIAAQESCTCGAKKIPLRLRASKQPRCLQLPSAFRVFQSSLNRKLCCTARRDSSTATPSDLLSDLNAHRPTQPIGLRDSSVSFPRFVRQAPSPTPIPRRRRQGPLVRNRLVDRLHRHRRAELHDLLRPRFRLLTVRN